MDQITNNETEVLIISQNVGSTISTIASLFIIISYCCSERFRRHVAFKMVLCVAISDLFDSIGNIFHSQNTGSTLCIIEGFLNQFGGISSVLWVVMVSWTVIYLIKHPQAIHYINSHYVFIIMNIIAWSLSIALSIPPFVTNSYGEDTGSCWLKGDIHSNHVLRLSIYYVPVCLSIFIIIILCSYAWFIIRKQNISITTNMKWVPIILLISFLPGTVRRIWDWGYHVKLFNKPPFELAELQAISKSLLGFFDCIVLVMNKNVLSHFIQFLRKCVCNKLNIAHDGSTSTGDSNGERTEAQNAIIKYHEAEEHEHSDSTDPMENDGSTMNKESTGENHVQIYSNLNSEIQMKQIGLEINYCA